MADTVAGSFSITITPQGVPGAKPIPKAYQLRSELHGRYLLRSFAIPANITDHVIPLVDFTTVSLVMLMTTAPISYKLGNANAAARSCRKVAIETPNNVALADILVTTGASAASVDLVVVGD